MTKRLFDIVFSLAGLAVLSPVFIVIAVLVKLDSRGPVFFRQKRIGRDFRPFYLVKFRSMVMDAQNRGLSITAGGDPRITGVGRLLRKTKLDELPQLWNVLKGEMSLVGPRPEVRKYVYMFRKDYREILRVRPGITDPASLTFSDEESVLKDKKDPEQYYVNVLVPKKLRLSRQYVKDSSLAYDIKLIFSTIFAVIYPHEAVRKSVSLPIHFRKPVVVGIHLFIFVLSSYLAFFIRYEGSIPAPDMGLFLSFIPLLLLIRFALLVVFSLDKGLWQYVSVRDLLNIANAVTLGSFLFFFIVRHFFGEHAYPRSVYVIDWMLNIFFLGGIRLLKRIIDRADLSKSERKDVIVIGAGDAADTLLREVKLGSRAYPYRISGLIDDDPQKKGLKIREVPILGTRKELAEIVDRERPDEFLIAIPSASHETIEEIVRDLRQYTLPIKIMPSLFGILTGRESLTDIKPVEPEDILFRAPVDRCEDHFDYYDGKTVMVTGAGGSIGSELCRQLAGLKIEKLVMFERHEESLYKIDKEFRGGLMDCGSFVPVVGDALDGKKVADTMSRHRPDVVFHAAAYKHVPLMEESPYEAFRTNVIGTRTVAEKARDAGVERFVLISTDKAVNPANVMGMTKKVSEEVVRCLASKRSFTRFNIVRFGNVLGSSGSVVPLFKEQIKKGGPVTITHPDITRYFMTIPEAVHLVLSAAAIGRGGDVFVLDMGKPVRILDLAKRMIRLYGYSPGMDIDMVFTGLRPGEKLYEELFNTFEVVKDTEHPKIKRAFSPSAPDAGILARIDSYNRPDLTRADVFSMLPGHVEEKREEVEKTPDLVTGWPMPVNQARTIEG